MSESGAAVSGENTAVSGKKTALSGNNTALSGESTTLGVREKIGYGLGDTASNIIFQVVINFMMIFYTDVFGLEAAAVGTLMLVVRLFDGVTDPLMGGLADRTRTRWGRYRPYLIWISIPYGVLAVLAFTTPDLGDNAKLVYAYVTYAVLMTIYTAINIPYSALGGVLTEDPTERASVQSFRFAMAMVGGAIVTALTLPMVDLLGAGDKALGFQLTMGVLASIAVLCFWICFYTTRERVVEESQAVKSNIAQDFFALLKNDQWNLVALVAVLLLILVAMRGAATPYYVIYFLQREDLVSWFFTFGMLTGVAGACCTNFLTRYVCKVRLFNFAILGAIVFHGALFFLPPGQVIGAFLLFGLANFFQLILVPLMFSMIPDTVDYGALKTGKKNMAMSYSAHLLAIKLGLAIGGALTGWLLDFYGYVPNQLQSESAMSGILVVFSLSGVVCGVAIAVVMRLYKLTNRYLDEVHRELGRDVGR
ncbi:MFS transporter [Pseudomaricurvus alkylphenolicus]|nr:MFS transporter [Pseudomaricurvus alkylphenolicus]